MSLVKAKARTRRAARLRHKKESRSRRNSIHGKFRIRNTGKIGSIIIVERRKGTLRSSPDRDPAGKQYSLDSMAQGSLSFAIHEEPHTEMGRMTATTRGAESRTQMQIPTDNDETDPEDSESDEDDVDDSVAEDMRRMEENFTGISKKYRLINRIGEGA